MAGEIQVTTKLYAAKGGAQTANQTHNWTANMSGDPDVLTQTQEISHTTEESLDIGPDIGAPYIVEIANIDSTNYVEVGVATGVYFARIPAGQTLFIPYVASGVTIFLKANTAAVNIVATAAEL
jgi:hypothetical protein